MIPEKSAIEVQSTVVGKSIDMQIDNQMLTHIMGILTDLYADRVMAIIREYSCNAIDSHVAAGTTRPIEVNTPTSLRPVFTIRDYGVGLDEDDIRTIYSRYGVSTKRDSNDVVGMLGIGCKSALAYVDQFTVIGFKDGVRTTVVVSRDSEGTGKMVVLEKRNTDEPNGVEIIVGVNAHDDFAFKARQFFRFWEPGTVLLDGVEPERIDGYDLSENMALIQESHDYGRNAWIVMGNVPYPAQLEVTIPYGRTLVVRVPIGSVQFAPSREALQDTDHTKAALKAIEDRYEQLAKSAAQREADDSRTAPEAARRAARAARLVNRKVEATWNGERVPDTLDFPNEASQPFVAEIVKDSSASRTRHVQIGEAANGLWVLGFTNQVFSRPMRAKLLAYCVAHDIGINGNAITYHGPQVPSPKWIGDVQTVDWEDVRRWRDPNKKRATHRGRTYGGAYDGIDVEGRSGRIRADGIDETLPIFYSDRREHLATPDNHAVLCEAFDGCYLVRMPSNRIAKFKRLFPTARPAREALFEVAAAWWQNLSGGERIALAGIGGSEGSYFYSTPSEVLLDLGLGMVKEIADRDLRTLLLAKHHRTDALVDRFGVFRSFLASETLAGNGPKLSEVAARYPLCPSRLPGESQAARCHLLLYLNAAHEAAGKDSNTSGI